MTGVDKPIENSIKLKLEKGLSPSFLEIFNESYMHNVPEGAETHFKVVVVSEQFSDQPLIKVIIRHLINNSNFSTEIKCLKIEFTLFWRYLINYWVYIKV